MSHLLIALASIAAGILEPQEPLSRTGREVLAVPPGLFVENRGQWADRSPYQLIGTSMAVALEKGRIRYRGGPDSEAPRFSLSFGVGDPEGERGTTRINWMVGEDPAVWRLGLPAYPMVRYRDLAEGVDLVVFVAEDGLRYDLELAAGSDPSAVILCVEGVEGLSLAETGELVLQGGEWEVRQSPPVAWQDTEEGRRRVSSAFRLLGKDRFGFAVEGMHPEWPLTIDPTLQVSYESFFIDRVRAVEADPNSQDFFLGGGANGAFPLPGTETLHAIGDGGGAGNEVAYVARMSPSNPASLVYLTLFGGSDDDSIWDLTLDSASGRLWGYGSTRSGDFPVTVGGPGPADDVPEGFLIGFDAALGTLHLSTMLDVELNDIGNVVLDGGRALMSGTLRPDADPSGFQSFGNLGDRDAFVLAVDLLSGARTGGFLVGDVGTQRGSAVAVDPGNAVYLTGYTEEPGSFPETPGALGVPVPPTTTVKRRGQTTVVPPPEDMFVVRFSPDLSQVQYSTRIGGESTDTVYDAVMSGSSLILVGGTRSDSLTPSPVGGDATYAGGDFGDGMVVALDFEDFVPGSEASPAVLLVTYLGGSGSDVAAAVDVDGIGRIHVSGVTSPGSGRGKGKKGGQGNDPFPEVDNGTGLFKQGPDGEDGFYSVFDLGSPDTLVYSTLIGGAGTNEEALHLAVSPLGVAHVVILLKTDDHSLPVTNNAIYPLRVPGLNSWIAVIGPVLY